MEKDKAVDDLNKTSSLSSKSKTNFFVLVLIVLLCFIVFGAGGYYLGTKLSVNKQIITETSSSQNTVKEEMKVNKSSLPLPIIRVKKQLNYSNWTQYKDKSGYSFYYPNDWFIREGQQVQNWDPNSPNLRPGPLSGEETKWDISFNEQSSSSFEEAMTQADTGVSNWDSIEVSSTSKGWPVYFAYKEKTVMGNSYLVAVVVAPENKILSWHGFSGDTKSVNIEKLKQIVESLQK